MAEDPDKIAESEWREAFRLRLRAIQGKRTHNAMADLIGISSDTWNKCVNRGDMFPIRKLPRLANLAEMTVEELIEVDKPAKHGAQSKPRARKQQPG